MRVQNTLFNYTALFETIWKSNKFNRVLLAIIFYHIRPNWNCSNSECGIVFQMNLNLKERFVAGTPNRTRRGERESARGNVFMSQTSTVTEAASDDIDDFDGELPRVTQ